MADEPVIDVTNSEGAIPTAEPATTATATSTTEATTPTSDAPPADGLDAPSLLDGAPAEGAEGGDGEGAKPDGEAVQLHGAPEGDYELELPEGISLDSAALEKIAPLARELNLSNKGLSELALRGLPVAEEMVQQAMVESVTAERKAWETDARALVQGGKLSDGSEITASPVFAGENMNAVMATAAKALDRFTNDENGQPRLFPRAKVDPETGEASPGTFRDFLKTTGIGNHPAMLQFAYLAGRAISEDSGFERSGDTPQSKMTREAKYYPHRQGA